MVIEARHPRGEPTLVIELIEPVAIAARLGTLRRRLAGLSPGGGGRILLRFGLLSAPQGEIIAALDRCRPAGIPLADRRLP